MIRVQKIATSRMQQTSLVSWMAYFSKSSCYGKALPLTSFLKQVSNWIMPYELESRSLSNWAFRWLAQGQPVRPPEVGTQLGCAWSLAQKNCETINTCCFELLSFGVTYCTVIDNQVSFTSRFHLKIYLNFPPLFFGPHCSISYLNVFPWFFNSKSMFSSFVQGNYSDSIFNNTIIWSTFKLLQWELSIIADQTLYSYLLLCFCNYRNRCLYIRLGSWKEWYTFWWDMDSGGSRAQYK